MSEPTEIELRQREAYKMRLGGWMYKDIAKALDVSTATAYQDVKRQREEVNEHAPEDVVEARAMELDRLDKMFKTVWDRALSNTPDGDFAIDRCLRISQQRAKLLGLDAPEKHALIGGEIVLDVVGTEVTPAVDVEPPMGPVVRERGVVSMLMKAFDMDEDTARGVIEKYLVGDDQATCVAVRGRELTEGDDE